MGYTTAYQIRFQSDEATVINVSIYDKLSFTTSSGFPTEFIDLGEVHQGNYPSPPVTIKTVDDNKDKFLSIRTKIATIQFFSSNAVDVTLFNQGEDDRFYVEILIEGTTTYLFKGFLVMDDHQRPFQPHPNIVTLTATDNLAILKDKPLTDFSNNYPRDVSTDSRFKIIQFIAWALAKTNLKLDILVANTFYEESFPNLCAWDNIYLSIKTFEKEIGFAEDCYSVLQKILSYYCTLSQWNGYWYISNVDELDLSIQPNPFWFDWQGTSKGSFGTLDRRQPLLNQDRQEDQVISFMRPNGYVKLAYNYETPKEIIDNIDFRRGNWLSPIVVDLNPYIAVYTNFSDMPIPGTSATIYKVSSTGNFYRWNGLQYVQLTTTEIPQALAYQCDDWVMLNNVRTISASAYIVRLFILGVETQRFLRINPANTNASPWDYFRCNPLPIGYLDRATVSVDFRWESPDTNNGPDGRYIFTFYILGSDANYYCYDQPNGKWTNIGVSLSGTNFGWSYQWDSRQNNALTYQTASADLPAFPIDGLLYVGIYNGYNFDSGLANKVTVDYTNLQFIYIPFINGGYQKFSGQYRLVSQVPDYQPLLQYYPGDIVDITTMQTGNYSAKIDDSISISDSPRPLFKGAMFKLNSLSQFVAATNWYAGGSLAAQGITPDPTYMHPIGHLQIYALWNKARRVYEYIQGTYQGLNTSTGNLPELNSIFLLNNSSDYTNNKKFIACALEVDYDTCLYKVTLLEISDVTQPNQYEGQNPELFQYIIS